VLGIVNALVRPIISLIAMPITCLTLGLFQLVIAGLMLLLVSAIPFLDFQSTGSSPRSSERSSSGSSGSLPRGSSRIRS